MAGRQATMTRIDGHLHLVRNMAGFNGNGRLNALGDGRAVWDTGEELRVIPKGYGDETFLVADALRLMATGGVEKGVLLQGSLNGYQNAYTAEVVKQYPDKFVGAFGIDIFAQNVRQIVQYHVETLGFRVLKLEISAGGGLHGYHAAFNLATMPILTDIFNYIANFTGMTIVVDYGEYNQVSHQPAAIVALAERYPAMNFVVAHLSFPHVDQLDTLGQTLQVFSAFKNIYLDLSAIQDIDQDVIYPFPKSQKVVRLAVDIVGSDHLIWGSDAPLSATLNSYHKLANWLVESGEFTTTELADMYCKTAEKVYFNSVKRARHK